MTRAIRWKRYRPTTKQVVGTAAALVASALYFGGLHNLDGRASTYLDVVRQEEPTRYLRLLRSSQGFDAFLAEYRAMEGYESFREMPPSFLIGRWTPRPATLRLAPGTSPDECSEAVVFGHGRYLALENEENARPVNYRIEGDTVQMRYDTGETMSVQLVSYGGELDHITFVPPGAEVPVHGYLCGR